MQAIGFEEYGAEDVLKGLTLPRPILTPNQVLIRVGAAGVNPADVAMRKGQFKALIKIKFPFVPGIEVSGIVEEIGAEVTALSVGQAVYAALPTPMGGGYAELVAVDADLVAPLPANLTFEEAAGVPLTGLTALQALRDKAQLSPGKRILINGGSGGVGTFAVQLAKAMGAHVTATCSTRNLELVRSLGADRVLDYTKIDITAEKEAYDVVFDAVNTFPSRKGLRTLKPDGILVSVNPILGNPVTNFFAGLRDRNVRSVMVRPNAADLKTLTAWIEQGKVRPVIDQTYPLADTAEAHRYSATKRARGKLILRVTEMPVSAPVETVQPLVMEQSR